MKHSICTKIAFLLLLLNVFVACDSKEKAGTAGVLPGGKAAAGGAASPSQLSPVVSEKDKTDARAQAERLLAQMKSGDYATIYRESAAPFKELGTEPQFVTMMQNTRQKTGAMKSSTETGQETGPDMRQMVNYSVQYENVLSNLRLSFLRSAQGKMELVGLNQKDAAVQPQAIQDKKQKHEAAKKK